MEVIMILLKNNILNLLHAKSNGPYLSCYFEVSNPVAMKKKIKDFMKEAQEKLLVHLSEEQIKKFIEPLGRLTEDTNLLKQFKRCVGIFRSQDNFQLIDLPIVTSDICVVSNTYHVKPILKWAQSDLEYYFLGLNAHGASLYKGSIHTFKHIDSIFFPEIMKKYYEDADSIEFRKEKNSFELLDGAMTYVADWLDENLKSSAKPIYLAGSISLINLIKPKIEHLNVEQDQVSSFFSKTKAVDLNLIIRSRIRQSFQHRFEAALINFLIADEIGLARVNIFQIAKDAVAGKIKTLFIAEDFKLWGKLNPVTGEIEVSTVSSPKHDDDLLDDIAQKVIEKGGVVVLSKLATLPNKRPISAILHQHTANVELLQSKVV